METSCKRCGKLKEIFQGLVPAIHRNVCEEFKTYGKSDTQTLDRERYRS